MCVVSPQSETSRQAEGMGMWQSCGQLFDKLSVPCHSSSLVLEDVSNRPSRVALGGLRLTVVCISPESIMLHAPGNAKRIQILMRTASSNNYHCCDP